ncbi:IgGFc-binding protein-like [Mercenaria mercenaria]|uniref:IgGFc-binding protein-like n=1 Tax=Mercenaria mercenaria TaxID=6596 RepID=UPI00234F1107|nr:IgGFc-binding protein-like [Mercenaria mercenaria]
MMETLMFLVLLFGSVVAADQCHVKSTSGTDFIFGIPGTYGNPTSIQILLTTTSSADVRVTAPSLNLDKHYVFTKHTTIPIAVTGTHQPNGTQFKAIELHSNAPIWAAVMLGNGNNFEGFLLVPRNVLSTKYNVASYPPYLYGNYYFSEFLVVGTDSDTTVDIDFPKTFSPAPNGRTSVQLQKYETYLFRSLSDVTGAIITSDKPVAVISGASCAQVPAKVGDCQYLVEQMLPTDVYDFKFIIPAIPPTKNYYVRIFATNDNTEVNFHNSSEHTSTFINEGEPLEKHFYEEPTILLADKPISVIMYSENPFMMTAQALTQFQSEYNFALQGVYAPNTLAVTIKTADIPDLYLDGSRTAIDTAKRIQVSTPLHEYTTLYIDVSQATIHRLHHAKNARFGALIYGLASASAAYGIPLKLTLTNTACYQGNNTNSTVSYPGQGQGLGSHINYKPIGNGVHCFNCEDMTHLKYCDKVTTCSGQDQVCYVQSYSKSLNTIRYRSGCIDKHRCTAHGQHGCMECCNGSYCNTYGCGDDGLRGLENRGPFCFDCRHQGANDVCETVQLCSVTEICMIEKYKWGDDDSHFIMGCTDAQMCSDRKRSLATASLERTNRNVPVCSKCCDTDFCNINCTTDNNPLNIIG